MPEIEPLNEKEKALLNASGGYTSIQDIMGYAKETLNQESATNINYYGQSKATPFPAKALGLPTFYKKSAYKRLGFNPWENNFEIYKNETTKAELMQDAQKAHSAMHNSMFSFFGTNNGGPDPDSYLAAKNYEDLIELGSPIGRDDAFAWGIKQYVQAGYTTAIISSIVAEEIALAVGTAVTGGASGAAAWAKTVKNFKRLAKLGDTVHDANKFKKVYDVGRMAKDAKSTAGHLKDIQNVADARGFWNKAKAIGRQAISKGKSLGGKTVDGVFPHAVGYAKAVKDGSYALNGFANVNHAFGAFWRTAREFNLAFDESSLEKAFVEKDAMRDMIQAYRDKHNGEDPVGSELDKIRDIAASAGNATWQHNVGLIYLTNRVGFGTLFGKFAPKIFKESIRATKYGKYYVNPGNLKTGLKPKAAFLSNKFFQGFKNLKFHLSKSNLKAAPMRTARYLASASAMASTEGAQEYFQEVIQDAQLHHANDKYATGIDGSILSYYGNSMEKFISPEGAEVFLSGFAMGGFSGPHSYVANKTADVLNIGIDVASGNYKKNRDHKRKMQDHYEKEVEKINDLFNKPWSKDTGLGGLATYREQDKKVADQNKAVEDGDQKAFMDIKEDTTLDTVYGAIEKGTIDTLVDQIEQMDQLTDDEILEAFSDVLPDDASKKDILAFKKDATQILDRINLIKEIKKDVDTRYINKYTYASDDAAGDDQTFGYNQHFMHQAFEHAKKQIVKYNYSYLRTVERTESITKDFADNPPFYDLSKKGPASDYTFLLNMVDMYEEVNLLKGEIAMLEDTPTADMSPKQKQDLKYKKKQYEILSHTTVTAPSTEEIPWKNGTIFEVEGKRYKQVTSPTEDIGKYYQEIDADGNNIEGSSQYKKSAIEKEIRATKKGKTATVPGLAALIEELRKAYAIEAMANKKEKQDNKDIQEGKKKVTPAIGMTVNLITENGGKGKIEADGNDKSGKHKHKPGQWLINKQGGGTFWVSKKKVSVDPLTIKAQSVDGLLTEPVLKQLYDKFKEYMEFLAEKNGTTMKESSLDDAFQKLLDFYALKQDGKNLTDLLSQLMNPQGFQNTLLRKAEVEKHIWENKKEIIANSIAAAYEAWQKNFLMQQLKETHNVGLLEDDAVDLFNEEDNEQELVNIIDSLVFYDLDSGKPVDRVSSRHNAAKVEVNVYIAEKWEREHGTEEKADLEGATTIEGVKGKFGKHRTGEKPKNTKTQNVTIAGKVYRISSELYDDGTAIFTVSELDTVGNSTDNSPVTAAGLPIKDLTESEYEAIVALNEAETKAASEEVPGTSGEAGVVEAKPLETDIVITDLDDDHPVRVAIQALLNTYNNGIKKREDFDDSLIHDLESYTSSSNAMGRTQFIKAIREYNAKLKEEAITKEPKVETKPPVNVVGGGEDDPEIEYDDLGKPIVTLTGKPVKTVPDPKASIVTSEVNLDDLNINEEVLDKIMSGSSNLYVLEGSPKLMKPIVDALIKSGVIEQDAKSLDDTNKGVTFTIKVKTKEGENLALTFVYEGSKKGSIGLITRLNLPKTKTNVYKHPIEVADATYYATDDIHVKWLEGAGELHLFTTGSRIDEQKVDKTAEQEFNEWKKSIIKRLNAVKLIGNLEALVRTIQLEDSDKLEDGKLHLGAEGISPLVKEREDAIRKEVTSENFTIGEVYELKDSPINIGLVTDISNGNVTFMNGNNGTEIKGADLGKKVLRKIEPGTDMNEFISSQKTTTTKEEEGVLKNSKKAGEKHAANKDNAEAFIDSKAHITTQKAEDDFLDEAESCP